MDIGAMYTLGWLQILNIQVIVLLLAGPFQPGGFGLTKRAVDEDMAMGILKQRGVGSLGNGDSGVLDCQLLSGEAILLEDGQGLFNALLPAKDIREVLIE